MVKISQFDPVIRFDLARTIAGTGFYWTTAYLVDGILIDSGCAHTALELDGALKDTNLRCIVNTHSHEDHIGANGLLQDQRENLTILAHQLALPIMAQPGEMQSLHLYRCILWGWPNPSEGRQVRNGEIIETPHHRFQVIYTPGHSPDHICLYEQDRGWLFTGDLFLGGRDRALRADYDIWQIIASLKKVAELPLTKIFPGSARIRDHNPNEELRGKIDYLEEAGRRVLELHQQGLKTNAIARSVFGAPMLVEFFTLGHFSRRNLVRSYLRRYL